MKKILIILSACFATSFSGFSQNLIQAEYFWDTDPGQGSANTLLATDGNFDEMLEDVFQNVSILPSVGVHSFNVRIKDNDNNWSPVFSTVVNVSANSTTVRDLNIIQAEYFWDTDPGQGNANVLLALDGNLNSVIENIGKNILILPSVGVHTLNVRIKDQIGNWSPIFSTVVSISSNSTIVRNLDIVQGELFFDTDPGYGQGMPLLALDGNFNSVLESFFAQGLPNQITAGIHAMHVRIKDTENNWSPDFVTVINMDTSIFSIEARIVEGDTLFCSNTPLNNQLFVAYINPNATYEWFVTNGTIQNGQTNDSVTITWSGTFPASLKLKVCDGGNCDSTTYIIDTLPVTFYSFKDTICDGSSYVLGGNSYTTSGIYKDTLVNSFGCDSIITLNLTVDTTPVLNITATGNTLTTSAAYQTYKWYLGGNLINGATTNTYVANVPGDYIVEATTLYGCTNISSTYTHDTSGNGCLPTIVISSNKGTQVCTGTQVIFSTNISNGGTSPVYQWKKNGNNVGTGLSTYTTSSLANGDKIWCVLTSNAACANPAQVNSDTLVFNVASGWSYTINDTICFGSSYMFKGNALTTSGTYYDTLSIPTGCDSIVTLNLTVDTLIDLTITASGNTLSTAANYPSYQWYLGGNLINGATTNTYIANTSGTYTVEGITTYGCSKISSGYTHSIGGGCTPNGSSIVDSICPGDSYTFGGNTYTNAGTYYDTLLNTSGCDSIVTLTLSINSYLTSNNTASICQGDTYLFRGNTYTTQGIYYDTVTNSSGCDSIIRLTLSVSSSVTPSITIASSASNICGPETLTFTPTLINEGNTPSINWLINGVVVANGPTFTTNPNQLINGDVVSAYLLSSLSCITQDTVYANAITVTVGGIFNTTILDTICNGETYTFVGNTYTQAGTYQDTLISSNGCDSIVKLILAVNPTPTVVANSSKDTVLVNEVLNFNPNGSNASNYLWSFSDGFFSNNISVNRAFTSPGTYLVILEGEAFGNNCKARDSINIVVVANVGINELTNNHLVSVYPNPTKDYVWVNFNGDNGAIKNITLFDTKGNLILTQEFGGIKQLYLDISSYERGFYFLEITGDNLNKKVKLIKN